MMKIEAERLILRDFVKIVDFGFRHFGVHRIWADLVADNIGSVHVLEKLGE